jgi:FHS family L-fucose permease-like MFS transporter
MVGRFVGSALMTRIQPGLLLGVHAGLGVLLVATAATSSGTLAMYSILAVGLCNSIMFPTIFSLALHGLGRFTSTGSAALCLAIVGGALVPLLQGVVADAAGLRVAFTIPIFCYGYICWYGFKGSSVRAGFHG